MVSFSRPAHWPRWVRYIVIAVAVVTVLAATAVVGYRVLAPAETSVPATGRYPDRPTPESKRYGELTSAPLIVDGRLRVFADARRVWADAPITSRTEVTPYWTYRRWPAEVVGVVAVEGRFEGAALVIVKFSDGVVVAINPRTGRVAWQDKTRAGDRDTFAGRRTGAFTVYQPAGIFTARSSTDGAAILIVSGDDQVIGYDPWSGRRRWEHTFSENPGCHDVDWTGETAYVSKDSCSAPAVLSIFDAATGTQLGRWQPPGALSSPAKDANWFAEPASCVRGYSGCALIRAAATSEVADRSIRKKNQKEDGSKKRDLIAADVWRLNHDGTITQEKHSVTDKPFLLGESLVELRPVTEYGPLEVHAVDRATGVSKWPNKVAARWLVYVDHTGVYVITEDFRLVVLHPATGVELSRTDLRKVSNEQWVPGFVHVAGRFIAIERTTGGNLGESDDRYYYGTTPIVLAGV